MGPNLTSTSMNAAAPRRRTQRILLVDDNPENLTLLSALLDMRGYSVLTAATAEAAHELITRQAPDLVLLDVVLPGRSGYELCRELKENPETRLVPVVLITGLKASATDWNSAETHAVQSWATGLFCSRQRASRFSIWGMLTLNAT